MENSDGPWSARLSPQKDQGLTGPGTQSERRSGKKETDPAEAAPAREGLGQVV